VLRLIWPKCKRGLQSQSGGKQFSDIEGAPYHIECSKGGESIWAKWKQANEDSLETLRPPIVIKQRDRESPVVMMSFTHWLGLMMECRKECHSTIEEVFDFYKKEFGKL
jgi:hypothetical protein